VAWLGPAGRLAEKKGGRRAEAAGSSCSSSSVPLPRPHLALPLALCGRSRRSQEGPRNPLARQTNPSTHPAILPPRPPPPPHRRRGGRSWCFLPRARTHAGGGDPGGAGRAPCLGFAPALDSAASASIRPQGHHQSGEQPHSVLRLLWRPPACLLIPL
jgi:hypothetical protein